MKPADLINMNISYDSEFGSGYSFAFEELLNEYFFIAEKGKRSGRRQLKRKIKQYPTVPEFKFFLAHWYWVRGEQEKSFRWSQVIVKRHPNFLIARIILANQYLERFQSKEVLKLFDVSFDLGRCFPELTEIHVSEAILFLDLVCRYYIQTEEFDRAEIYLKCVEELSPKSPFVEHCKKLLLFEQMMLKHKFQVNAYNVKTAPPPETTKTTPPIFTHKEINVLYEANVLSQSNLNKLYALPRESLIKDLEKVIQDGWERYSYFLSEYKISKENTYFIFHAMMMLAELKATESYPIILKFLSQNDNLIDLYLGILATEYIWQVHYELGPGQIDRMLEFMKKPKIDAFSKTELSVALVQMLLHDKISREKALAFYEEVLLFFLEAKLEDEVIDCTLIGLIISNIIGLKLLELIDLIRKLYEKEYVDITVNGSWEVLIKKLETGTTRVARKREQITAYALK